MNWETFITTTRLLRQQRRGFVLPFTMLVSALILFVTFGTMTLLSKQLYFSKNIAKSQIAYYAADDAVACAMDIDDTYVSSDGLGIFPYSSTTNPVTLVLGNPSYGYITDVLTYVNDKRILEDPGATVLTLNDIKCGQAVIFDTSPSSDSKFSVDSTDYRHHYVNPLNGLNEIEYGLTSTYFMRMPVGGGAYRCAKVTVNKTQSFRQIIAQGYSICDNPNSAVERAVVNTTVVN